MHKNADFEPYIKTLPVKRSECSFFYGTPQAKEWYDPLKPYALLEYEWVAANIDLKYKKIIDAGAHHGQYTVVFAVGSGHTAKVTAVDPVPSNIDLIRVNLAINHAKAEMLQCVVSNKNGSARFIMESNGRIVNSGGVEVASKRLSSIMPDPDIIKLDIEGGEYMIFPDQLHEMKTVNTWIIEIHPQHGNPQDIISSFDTRDFQILWVNRDRNIVEPYPQKASWKSHTTLFFLRR